MPLRGPEVKQGEKRVPIRSNWSVHCMVCEPTYTGKVNVRKWEKCTIKSRVEREDGFDSDHSILITLVTVNPCLRR